MASQLPEQGLGWPGVQPKDLVDLYRALHHLHTVCDKQELQDTIPLYGVCLRNGGQIPHQARGQTMTCVASPEGSSLNRNAAYCLLAIQSRLPNSRIIQGYKACIMQNTPSYADTRQEPCHGAQR